uniref:Uncharacterized protein n=1 Tax=Aeromonas phage vB_AdhaM_G2 TaxID=3238786 RepID=A0AB39TZ37_9CAUD
MKVVLKNGQEIEAKDVVKSKYDHLVVTERVAFWIDNKEIKTVVWW